MRSFENVSSKVPFLSHFSYTVVIWGVNPPPWGANENFLAHSTDAKSLRTIISNICEKIIKI